MREMDEGSVVGVVYMDVRKVSDEVPPGWLK